MMHLLHLWSKCRDYCQKTRRDQELDREISSHLALIEEDLLTRGLTPHEAHHAARRAYGGVEQAKQLHREERSFGWLDELSQNLLYAARRLSKSPGFSLTVILTVALGIGANTAIFTLVHSILMKSLPVGDPQALYRIGDQDDCCLSDGLQNDSGDFDVFSYPQYQYLRESTPEFDRLAAMQASVNPVSVRRGNGAARTEKAEYVSDNYFTTLGVGAFAGRVFNDSEADSTSAPSVVMSYQTWQSDFGSDPSILGATLHLQSHPVTVVGIAPAAFFGDRVSSDPPAFWIPLSAEPLLTQESSLVKHVDQCWLYLLGRVRPGTAVNSLQQKLSANLRQYLYSQSVYSIENDLEKLFRVHVVLTPGGAGIKDLQQKTGNELYLLLAVTAFVLLVACANVANLLLARGSRQKAEISLRIALGSARARLIRQMLTESVLLALTGGVAGLALAYSGTRVILALAFPESPHNAIHATPSLPILGFAFLLSLVTGVVFGIVPAWITSQADPAEALKEGSRTTGDRASLTQRSLIVFQAALSLVLLVGAGLLTRSLRNLEHQDFGFNIANRYVVHLDPSSAGYQPGQLDALNQSLERRLASIPGMRDAALAVYSPFDGNDWSFSVYIPGRPKPGPDDDNNALINRVSPDYFAAVGEPVLQGRGITAQDTAASPFIAVVNQAFVHKYFPHENAIGRSFNIYEREDFGSYRIAGVVADAKYRSPRRVIRPMFFCPLSQWRHNLKDPTSINLETQTHYITAAVMNFRGTQAALYGALRESLARVNPDLTIIDLRSLDSQLAGNFNQERLIARLTSLFGLLTLILASVGLYGIMSYQTTRRTREIGLRMAFGADRRVVILLVMRAAFIQVALGLVLGVPIALLGAHIIAKQLYLVKSYDPISLIAAVFVLAAAAAIAGFLPARRAASIDPMHALRIE